MDDFQYATSKTKKFAGSQGVDGWNMSIAQVVRRVARSRRWRLTARWWISGKGEKTKIGALYLDRRAHNAPQRSCLI